MRIDEIGERYASALFSVAHSTGCVDEVGDSLNSISSFLLDNELYLKALKDPLLEDCSKDRIVMLVAEAAKSNDVLVNCLKLMVQNGRASKIVQANQAFQSLRDQSQNRMYAQVTSARKLTKKNIAEIKAVLSEQYKAEIILEPSIAPDLIAGFRVQVGSTLIDGSAVTRLNAMKDAMRAG